MRIRLDGRHDIDIRTGRVVKREMPGARETLARFHARMRQENPDWIWNLTQNPLGLEGRLPPTEFEPGLEVYLSADTTQWRAEIREFRPPKRRVVSMSMGFDPDQALKNAVRNAQRASQTPVTQRLSALSLRAR